MNAKQRFTGATPLPTSNPFGNARLRPVGERRADLVTALRDRVRAAVARARHVVTRV